MNTERAWLYWWTQAWRNAHPDWQPPGLAGIAPHRLETLARSRHAALGRLFGIDPAPPPRPRAALLELSLAAAPRRTLACTLVAAICAPQADHSLSTGQQAWSLSIAKAMRPGHWLAEGEDSLNLLRAWVGASVWQRLRLGFARDRIERLEQRPPPMAPAARLEALWQAALWRSAQDLLPPPPS